MLVLSPDSAIVARIRDTMSARAIREAAVLAWSDTIRRAFTPSPEISNTRDSESHSAEHSPQTVRQTVRPKKKGSQSLSAVWYEWFTAEPRVHASRSIQKTTLYEFRHTAGYMMLFIPSGFALDAASPAFKSEVLSLGEKAQEITRAFLKTNGSTAAAGTVLKAFRKLYKAGKIDAHIAQFHDRVERGEVVDPTPPAAFPRFIRFTPVER
ncbi:hypothetical protein PC110_g10521 [Phytophthora cactorum]|uniref:Uncharacterized protein n=1 Tax=Phytophthora cactorum TaxID=29920 RepID=A0A329SB73_9STRA|nr:hypothetical protein PC110_g10521 [Phytophthora cactorum]